MPIDPVKIPQNVYIEDRIVGPLTLRQTLIIAGGGGFSYALYAMLSKTAGQLNLITTIIVWIPCAICVIFALVKINNLSLLRICLLMLERIQKPSVRQFSPRRGISINIRMSPVKGLDKADEQKKATEQDAQAQARIKELSTVLDKGLPQNVQQPWEEEVQVEAISPAEDPIEDTLDTVADETDTDESTPRLPVDPKRISVDQKSDNENGTQLSDLSAFRDIFPHS